MKKEYFCVVKKCTHSHLHSVLFVILMCPIIEVKLFSGKPTFISNKKKTLQRYLMIVFKFSLLLILYILFRLSPNTSTRECQASPLSTTCSSSPTPTLSSSFSHPFSYALSKTISHSARPSASAFSSVYQRRRFS